MPDLPQPVLDSKGRGTVLVTGAARGIGRATASALGARGHRLGLIDLDSEALGSFAAELRRGESLSRREPPTSVTAKGCGSAVAAFEQTVGPIDVVVACAGVGYLASATDMHLDGFRSMLEINVLGVARTIEAVSPGMFARKRGHIVGIASLASYRGLPWMPGYSASKAALTNYLEGLRPAFKIRGVRITTVCPGFVRTAMTADQPFRRPVPMLEPEQAGEYVARAVEKRPRDVAFPLSAALGMGLLRRLPNWAFDYCMDKAGPKGLTTEF